jgi:hypothetical protein
LGKLGDVIASVPKYAFVSVDKGYGTLTGTRIAVAIVKSNEFALLSQQAYVNGLLLFRTCNYLEGV